MEENKLLNCPCCNGKAKISYDNERETEVCCVSCGLCIYKCDSIDDFKSTCVSSWNRRTNGWDK